MADDRHRNQVSGFGASRYALRPHRQVSGGRSQRTDVRGRMPEVGGPGFVPQTRNYDPAGRGRRSDVGCRGLTTLGSDAMSLFSQGYLVRPKMSCLLSHMIQFWLFHRAWFHPFLLLPRCRTPSFWCPCTSWILHEDYKEHGHT